MAGMGKETDFDMEAVRMQAGVVGMVVADMAAAEMGVAGTEVVDTERGLVLERMVAVGYTGYLLVDH
jgi:hypothetical protein